MIDLTCKTLKGLGVQMTFSRSYGEAGEFRLSIEDKTSGTRIIEVEIPADQVANMVSTRPFEGKADLYQSSVIGKVHHNERVKLELIDSTIKCLHAAMEHWEASNPGKKLDEEHSFNHHDYDHSTKTYTVIARWYTDE